MVIRHEIIVCFLNGVGREIEVKIMPGMLGSLLRNFEISTTTEASFCACNAVVGRVYSGQAEVWEMTGNTRTIGGNAKALLGYPTTHQTLVAEEVSTEECVVSPVVLI